VSPPTQGGPHLGGCFRRQLPPIPTSKSSLRKGGEKRITRPDKTGKRQKKMWAVSETLGKKPFASKAPANKKGWKTVEEESQCRKREKKPKIPLIKKTLRHKRSEEGKHPETSTANLGSLNQGGEQSEKEAKTVCCSSRSLI